jgi:hypothetical protein
MSSDLRIMRRDAPWLSRDLLLDQGRNRAQRNRLSLTVRVSLQPRPYRPPAHRPPSLERGRGAVSKCRPDRIRRFSPIRDAVLRRLESPYNASAEVCHIEGVEAPVSDGRIARLRSWRCFLPVGNRDDRARDENSADSSKPRKGLNEAKKRDHGSENSCPIGEGISKRVHRGQINSHVEAIIKTSALRALPILPRSQAWIAEGRRSSGDAYVGV